MNSPVDLIVKQLFHIGNSGARRRKAVLLKVGSQMAELFRIPEISDWVWIYKSEVYHSDSADDFCNCGNE